MVSTIRRLTEMKSDDPSYHHPNPQRDVIEYFLPGHMILQVKHPADISEMEIIRAIGSFLMNPDLGPAWKNQLKPPAPGDLLKFPQLKVETPAFSMVRMRLRNLEASKEELVGLLKEIYTDLNPYKDDPKQTLRPIPITPDHSIQLKSVAPNWSISSGNHVPAFGGPGGWPKKNMEAEGNWPKFEFLEPSTNQMLANNSGAGVHIAILDTAPGLHELAEAYNEWSVHKKGAHPLLESLLEPGGPLHIYPAGYEELLAVADLSEVGHRYLMPDHGLFVAGILHTIAPQGQLHLYEVLNPYGVGSLETIARGILKVLDLLQTLRQGGERRPLLVNCSLTLGVSADGQADPDLPEVLRDPGILDHTRIAFEELVALLDQPDALVLAAAGNDASLGVGKPGSSSRPEARFPAAFPSVIGVGALPDQSPREGPFSPASYSNLADAPPQEGYVTLGGEEGVEKGIRGVFIGEYPQNNSGLDDRDPGIPPDKVGYEANEQGWAYWSGTSFATPIVSGLLAAWWSEDPNRLSSGAKAFLDSLKETDSTADGEKVILTRQV
jgi:hypothetical protein